MFTEEALWNSLLRANVSENDRKHIVRRLSFGLDFQGMSQDGKTAMQRMAAGIGRSGETLYNAISDAARTDLLGSPFAQRIPWEHLAPVQQEPTTYVRAKILDTESRSSEKAIGRIAQIARKNQQGAASKKEMEEALRLAVAARLPSTTRELRESIALKWPGA